MGSSVKKIILLRGLGKESRHWKDSADYLKEMMPEVETLALDLSGNGVHNKERTPLQMKEAVLRLREDLFRALPPNQETSLYLVGISMGGVLATAWHQQFPEDFKKMLLINTSFKALSPFYERLKPSAIPTLIKVLFTQNPKLKEKRLLRLVSNTSRRDVVLPLWAKVRKENPVSTMNTLRQLWLAWQNKTPPRWTIPCLLLASKKDRLVSWKCSEKIHKKSGLPIIYHPEAGHALSVDDPKWLADQIVCWIDHEKITRP